MKMGYNYGLALNLGYYVGFLAMLCKKSWLEILLNWLGCFLSQIPSEVAELLRSLTCSLLVPLSFSHYLTLLR